MSDPNLEGMSWERKLLIVIAVVIIIFLAFKFGAEILVLLGVGAGGTYAFRAKQRVDKARYNEMRASEAAERLRKSRDAIKDSRAKLDQLRVVLAERAAEDSKVDWDSSATAPAPQSLDDE